MNKMLSERSYLSYLKFLNENCPIDEEWECNDKVYQIKVNADDVDTINDWVEKIVGCSFFYDSGDEDDSVNLKITKSTLESHLCDKIIEDKFDYTPIKMDRFSLVKCEDHYDGGYHIVDNLIKDISRTTKGLYKTGIIFTACSDSESVNFNICQEVLRLLNTEESYVNMLDYVNSK